MGFQARRFVFSRWGLAAFLLLGGLILLSESSAPLAYLSFVIIAAGILVLMWAIYSYYSE